MRRDRRHGGRGRRRSGRGGSRREGVLLPVWRRFGLEVGRFGLASIFWDVIQDVDSLVCFRFSVIHPIISGHQTSPSYLMATESMSDESPCISGQNDHKNLKIVLTTTCRYYMYRVTQPLVPNLLLTLMWKLCFSIKVLILKRNFKSMSMGGLEQVLGYHVKRALHIETARKWNWSINNVLRHG